jgi:hypothetical protein
MVQELELDAGEKPEVVDWRQQMRWLVNTVENSILATGDLSIATTKLEHKGSKSEIIILNVHQRDIDLIPKTIESVAWSFKKDGIEIEQIPVRAHIKTKFMEYDSGAAVEKQDDAMSQGKTSAEGQDVDLDASQSQESNYSESVVQGDDADNFWDEKDDLPPESLHEEPRAENIITLSKMNEALEWSYTGMIKQLGITSTNDGNTAETTKSLLTKGILRLRDLKIHKIRGQPLPQAINTHMNSVLQYGSLLSKLFENMLAEIDHRVVTQVQSACGLTQTDTTSILYVGKEQKGYGVKSTIRTQVTSLCRKLEVTLNDPAPLHVIAAQGRFKAALEGEDTIGNSGVRDANYILEAMNFIGMYGIWIHDNKYMAFNVWMNLLAEDSNLFCVGDSRNHWDYGPSLPSDTTAPVCFLSLPGSACAPPLVSLLNWGTMSASPCNTCKNTGYDKVAIVVRNYQPMSYA